MTHIPQFSGTLTGLDTVKTKDEKRQKIRQELRQLGVKSALHKVDGDTRTTADGDSYTLDLRRKDGCSGSPQYFAVQAGDYNINLPRLKYYDNGKGFKKFCEDAINMGQTLSKAVSDPSRYISSSLIQDAKSLKRYKALRDVLDSKDMEDSLKKLKAKGFTLKVESSNMAVITDKDGKETFEPLPADKAHAASKLKELIRDKAGTPARTSSFTTPSPSDDDDDSVAGDETPQDILKDLDEDLKLIFTDPESKHPKNKFNVTLDEQFNILKPIKDGGSYVLSAEDKRTLKSLERKKDRLKYNLEAATVLSEYKRFAKRYKASSVDLLDTKADSQDLQQLRDNLRHYSEPLQEWHDEFSDFVKKLHKSKAPVDVNKLNKNVFKLDDDSDTESTISYGLTESESDFEDAFDDTVIDPSQALKDIKNVKGEDLLKKLEKYRQLKTDLSEYRGDGSDDDPAKTAVDALVAKFDKWDADNDKHIEQLKELPDTIASLNYKKTNEPGYVYNSDLKKAHQEIMDGKDEVTQFLTEMKDELSGLYKRCGKEDKLLSLYHPDGKEYGLLDVGAQYPVYESDLPKSQREGVSEYTKLRHLDKLRSSKQSKFHQDIQEKNIEKLRESRQKSSKQLEQESQDALAFDNSWGTWLTTPVRWLWSFNPFTFTEASKEGLKNFISGDA